MQKSVKEILKQLCLYKGVEIIEGHLMIDHIHMLISIPSKTSCKVPRYNGMEINIEEKKKQWDKYYMEAPEQQRQPVEQYKIVKRA
jgi:REP element-mobilizing transposase RayT